MIAVIQRVAESKVEVDGAIVGRTGAGMVVLVAVHQDDTEADISWMAGKLASLRIFPNGELNFDLDIRQAGGSMLLVSNFTVAAQTRRGRRPSLDAAAAPEKGRIFFDQLVAAVTALGVAVNTGRFGAYAGFTD